MLNKINQRNETFQKLSLEIQCLKSEILICFVFYDKLWDQEEIQKKEFIVTQDFISKLYTEISLELG